MSAQVIRVRADDRRRLVVDDELSAILRRCELHRDLFTRERGEVRRSARGFSVDRINRGVLADFHALLAWRNQHDPRVQRGLDLLSEGQNALLDLLRDDNRPPCPVIPLRLATVAPAKVPEPPARGKPNRGKPNPDVSAGTTSGSRSDDVRDAQLRAIAERAPEPARELYRG